MRILTKELHQQKWMVFAGCLVGLIFPAIEYWIFHEGPRRHESTSGAIAVLLGGAIFGILLALAAAYPDARKGSRDFFLARPFNCSRIFITKTLLAAVTLPMTLAVIAAPDFITSFGRTEHFALAWAIFTVTWPIALMIFSLTVFLMVLTQDQAKSLVLAAWSAVLVYLLPPFVNGFRWLSVPRHLEDAGQSVLLYLLGPPFQALIPELPRDPYGQPVVFVFEWKEMLPYLALVGAMAAMTIIFTWLAAVTVRRGWRWQPGRKTIVWAVGLASLLIFTQLVFQVGYNLRPANEVAGRPIQNPFHYNIKNALAASRPGMSGDLKVHYATSLAYGIVYSRDELMYSVVYAYERLKDSNGGKAKYIMHIILCTYRFPFTSQSNMPLDEDGPLLISAVSLFTSPKPVLQAFALGPVDGLFRDGWLYVCYQPHTQDPNNPDINKRLPLNLTAVNVSNPAAPILGPTISMPYTGRFGSRGFAVKGDYLYINAEQNLAIVSIESPGEPRLVREVPFSSLTPMSKLRQVPLGTFIYRFTVSGDLLLGATYEHLAGFDISEPTNPRTVFFKDHAQLGLTDKGPLTTYWHGEYGYLASYDSLHVVRYVRNQDGSYSLNRVGGRKATLLEKLAGRAPHDLIVHGRYLIEAAGAFGVLIYDISNPARPRRAFHADIQDCSIVGIWNGLLYASRWDGTITFFNLPGDP